VSKPSWRVAAAAVAGTSHLSSGESCQDEFRTRIAINSCGEPALVVCVADGAGSARMGAAGANLACRLWAKRVTQFAKLAPRLPTGDGKMSPDPLRRGFLHGWVRDVRAVIRARATKDGLSERDYACTFLGGYALHDRSVFVQIGDGAIVIRRDASSYEPVFWPSSSEYANETSFLTDDDAEDRIRYTARDGRIHDVALFTDGLQRLALDIGSQTAFSPFFESMFAPLRESSGDLTANLSAFLDSDAVNERTNDDKTLVLASLLRHD
jgi:hypothetical protein